MKVLSSIQEVAEKINSSFSFYISTAQAKKFLLFSFFTTLWVCSLVFISKEDSKVFSYQVAANSEVLVAPIFEGKVISSKAGKVYYFPWCKGVSRIKESNRIYFPSEESAKSSGREISKTCK